MKSIGLKLWTGMMVLVIVVLVLLWLFQIVFLESFYTRMRVSDVRREAASIAQLTDGGISGEFENIAEAFAFKNNLSIELLDRQGNSVYAAGTTGFGGQMPMMRNRERAEAFLEVFEGKEVIAPLTHPRFGNKFMLIALPVTKSDEITGVLYINMPLAPVEDTASILKKQLFYITLFLLVAALVISYVISRTFTKPILEIKKVSEKMASGDFSDRITARSSDEIGKLAETINIMGRELSRLEQLRKDLIANVSHELRTPLSLIRGYAETLRDVSGDVAEKRNKQLGIIIEESERLSKIVDDMLKLSQMQAGYLNITPGPFMINRTIEDVMKRFEILSEKTRIKLVYDAAGNITITADELRIEQVLFNLIHNAFNHTPEGGEITVRVTETQDNVKVEVTDTGTGISEEDIRHIWDRYYKADKNRERIVVGTGLGLSIVKSVLEAHKAQYGVESGQGAGTVFWFELRK